MFVWIIAAVVGQPGSRTTVPHAPVQSGYQGTVKPRIGSYADTYHPISYTAAPVQSGYQGTVKPRTGSYADTYHPLSYTAAPVQSGSQGTVKPRTGLYAATYHPISYSAAPLRTQYPATVETQYPVTSEPQLKRPVTSATHHYVEATRMPRTRSPVDHEYDYYTNGPEETYNSQQNDGSMSYDGSHDGSHDGHHDSYEHEHHESEEDDDMPECLKDCQFLDIDSEDSKDMCEWWKVEGQQANEESCLNDCSAGVVYVVNKKLGDFCAEEPVEEVDPLACIRDCPIHELDPHSAESFCPWFVEQKNNTCFHDCNDEFLNMAQAHAEYTCGEWYQGENRFTNFYINEPMADMFDENNRNQQTLCPAGYFRNEDRCDVCQAATYSVEGSECFSCPSDLTSFPGSTSEEECYKRKELLPLESYEDSYNGSEDYSQSADQQGSYSNDGSNSGEPSQ